MFDIAIIGAGVVGCAVARELSKYKVKVCVIERAEDVCCGTSKANSAIVHAGFDAVPGTLKAKLNVRGNEMFETLSRELDFPFKKIGSLVVCTKDQDKKGLQVLLEKGIQNKVPGLQILEEEELRKMEPNLSEDVTSALFAPTGAIVCPFELTIAMAENAVQNGVKFYFDREVIKIEKNDKGYVIVTEEGNVETKAVVNAAGVYADVFHNMVSESKLHISPRKGEYILFDKSAGNHVSHTIFQLPGKMGKGVLVTPTVHGNLLVGPTAMDLENKEGINTTSEGLEIVRTRSAMSVKNLPMRQVITSFAGLRAHEANGDFIIGEVKDAVNFFDAAGIASPGLTSAPAIGEMLSKEIAEKLQLKKKDDFCGKRIGMIRPQEMSLEERNALIKKQPAYGTIVCRCEMISEGEIIEAIHRPIGARSLDGVKRRTRAGMGRCQSGFCSPKTMEILERELKIEMSRITKSGRGSELILGENKRI